MTDAAGWVYSISDANSFGDQPLADYSYLGDGTMVGQYRPQMGANEAITLDNFGNTADLNWTNTSGTPTDHFGFGYDADGNVLYKQNDVLTTDSELYHVNGASGGYDGLNRLTSFSRGTLSASVSGGTLDTVSSPSDTQSWTLDTLGNQTLVNTNGVTQSKTPNAQNQTTSVTTGATTNNLTYDPNGATTTDEQGRVWTYDGWGDPITVINPATNQETIYSYNAMGQRISTDVTAAATAGPLLVINGGSPQRSMVDSLTLVFPYAVSLSSGAVSLTNTTTSTTQAITWSNPSGDGKTWLISYSGTGIVGHSLPNGIYNLTLNAADVVGSSLSGNVTWAFHRLFGDIDGSGTLDTTNQSEFAADFSAINVDPAFDSNADGNLNSTDSLRFKNDAGITYTYTPTGSPILTVSGIAPPRDCTAFSSVVTDLYYSTAGQLIEEDQGGSAISQTVYGVGYVNSVIEVDQATGSPGTLNQRVYVQQDADYNVSSVTDTSGNVLERYLYSPDGVQTVLNPDGSVKGDGTPASSSYQVPVGYQGMLFDPVLSDNLTQNRVYDPMLGTWTSQDPSGSAGSGNNLYQFVGGNPEVHADPSGLYSEQLDGISAIRWNQNDNVAEVALQISSNPSWFDRWVPGVGYLGSHLDKPNWVEWVPLRSLPRQFASAAGFATLGRLCDGQIAGQTQNQDAWSIREALRKDIADQINAKSLTIAGHAAQGATGLGPTGEGLLLAAGMAVVGGALRAIGDASGAGGAGAPRPALGAAETADLERDISAVAARGQPMKCTDLSSNLRGAITARGGTGAVISVKAPQGVDYIVQDGNPVAAGASITTNGYHEATEFNGKIYDYYNPNGIDTNTWLGSLNTRAGGVGNGALTVTRKPF